MTTYTVTTEKELKADIAAANAAASGSFVIDISNTIALTSPITRIALQSGVSLTIDGGGTSALDGQGKYNGLFVTSGNVQIQNLLIENAVATGAYGFNGIGSGGGGGGGAGLGGGLFVASGATVALTDVNFQGNSAVGGTGGPGGGVSSHTYGGRGGKGVIGKFGRGGRGAGSSNGAGGGGWGGGGGGAGPTSTAGAGGFGGGRGQVGVQALGGSDGYGGGGGGGLGAGGDIFVQQGASLTLSGGTLGAGTATGGAGGGNHFGGGPAQAGKGYGGGMFLQGNETITLAPASGTTEEIDGVIADQSGSGGTGKNAGLGSLTISGAGTVDLTAANTFKGGITIDSGVLELAGAKSGGLGGVDFAAGAGELLYAAGASLSNAVSGFGGADAIDFSTIAFAAGDHAVDNAGVVDVETSGGTTVASFTVLGSYQSTNFHVGGDASDDLLVTYAATAAASSHSSADAAPVATDAPSLAARLEIWD